MTAQLKTVGSGGGKLNAEACCHDRKNHRRRSHAPPDGSAAAAGVRRGGVDRSQSAFRAGTFGQPMNTQHLREISENQHLLDTLTSREFEELVAVILESYGLQVSLTPPTRDGGYDILAIQTGVPGLDATWIVECKKYAEDRRIGVEIVRNLFGVRDYLSIANAAIVTTASFTRDALDFARNRGAIKLIDRSQLIAWIKQAVAARPPVSPPPRFQSVFISYASKDEEFAQRLHKRLTEAGIRVWFAPEDLKGGEKLHEQLFSNIDNYDRLLLVLSPTSLQSAWVISELQIGRELEQKKQCRKLFPIRLVAFDTLRNWACFDADSGKDLA